jgi:hypothetical protein
MVSASGCVWVKYRDVFTEDLGAQGLQGQESVLSGRVLMRLIGDG